MWRDDDLERTVTGTAAGVGERAKAGEDPASAAGVGGRAGL